MRARHPLTAQAGRPSGASTVAAPLIAVICSRRPAQPNKAYGVIWMIAQANTDEDAVARVHAVTHRP